MTYALEIRAKTGKTRQMLEANEMEVLRKIVGGGGSIIVEVTTFQNYVLRFT